MIDDFPLEKERFKKIKIQRIKVHNDSQNKPLYVEWKQIKNSEEISE
jgi:5'(3')-deoxyribonucleotidase